MSALTRLFLVALLGLPMMGGELPLPTAAKLLNLISRGAGENGRVACKNAEMAAEIGKVGGEVSPASRVAWATAVDEVRMYSMQRKCVVVNDPKLLSMGGSMAIFESDGKVKMLLNAKSIAASGVTLSDQIMKAALSQ
jgi:general stress protein YciG